MSFVDSWSADSSGVVWDLRKFKNVDRPANTAKHWETLMSPRRVVWCRGGNRNVEGWWGFPYLNIKKFIGFSLSKFESFVFQSFKSRSSKVSMIPYWQNSVSGRDWPHIQEFQKFENGSSGIVGLRLSNISKNMDVRIAYIYTVVFSKWFGTSLQPFGGTWCLKR